MGLNIFPLALVAEVFIWNRVFSSDWQTEREIAAIFFCTAVKMLDAWKADSLLLFLTQS